MTTPHTIDWNSLHHAYGNAGDIPAMLEQLGRFPDETDWQAEPWFSLWSALYHQDDIYTASIAAVPRIVATLSQAPGKGTLGFYLLPASIAIADNANPVEVPARMRDAFTSAIATLGGIAAAALPAMTDKDMTKAAQVAVLVAQGDFDQAAELIDADL